MNLRWKIAQKLEIRWWRRYLQGKQPAAYLAAKQAYWQRTLATLGLEILPGHRVLDAGCGPAGVFIALPHCNVDAVDPLLEQYAQYLAHFAIEDYPNVRFFNQAIEDFRPEAHYNVVFCLNALNHVANIEKSCQQIVAALAPGGRLVVTVDVHKNTALRALFRAVPGDVLHPHQHALRDYVQLLRQQDCQILRTQRLKPGRIFDYYAIIVTKNV
jgi:2-polyprenyl-3-methyl-5-hydroxy-6-metoxy-1,4-benzoquinol methylase